MNIKKSNILLALALLMSANSVFSAQNKVSIPFYHTKGFYFGTRALLLSGATYGIWSYFDEWKSSYLEKIKAVKSISKKASTLKRTEEGDIKGKKLDSSNLSGWDKKCSKNMQGTEQCKYPTAYAVYYSVYNPAKSKSKNNEHGGPIPINLFSLGRDNKERKEKREDDDFAAKADIALLSSSTPSLLGYEEGPLTSDTTDFEAEFFMDFKEDYELSNFTLFNPRNNEPVKSALHTWEQVVPTIAYHLDSQIVKLYDLFEALNKVVDEFGFESKIPKKLNYVKGKKANFIEYLREEFIGFCTSKNKFVFCLDNIYALKDLNEALDYIKTFKIQKEYPLNSKQPDEDLGILASIKENIKTKIDDLKNVFKIRSELSGKYMLYNATIDEFCNIVTLYSKARVMKVAFTHLMNSKIKSHGLYR